jgi:hypothetical protein
MFNFPTRNANLHDCGGHGQSLVPGAPLRAAHHLSSCHYSSFFHYLAILIIMYRLAVCVCPAYNLLWHELCHLHNLAFWGGPNNAATTLPSH